MNAEPPKSSGGWKHPVLIIGIIIFGIAAYFAYSVYWLVNRKIPESYAAWTAGDLIVEHLRNHSNNWPRSWEDLQSAANSRLTNGMNVWTPVDRLPRYVKIDWDIDANALAKQVSGNPTQAVRVVTRLDGGRLSAGWGHEPNGVISNYLKGQ
jgi:hypothetical protein